MLEFVFVTIHPEFISSYLSFGVFASAKRAHNLKTSVVNLREYAIDRHGTIDDRPYGGGDGMVMRADCLAKACDDINAERVWYTSPCGLQWSQDKAQSWSGFSGKVAVICGRFGGLDQRFIDRYVTDMFSIGDFVISGGELASLLMLDSVVRYLPGGLGDPESANMDSFGKGVHGLLEAPLYTRPEEALGEKVPQVLMSGDHKKIKEWREQKSIEMTRKLRPDLLDK